MDGQVGLDLLGWNDDPKGFEAWCEGRTGFPIVDAGMRQLRVTGWMHNRVRMIVEIASGRDHTRQRKLRRFTIPVPVLTPRLSSLSTGSLTLCGAGRVEIP
jgi:hypothetical protein